MWNAIRSRFLSFKNRLTSVGGEEPLSKLSLVVIIVLDIFVLSMVFEGLYDHTKQLTSPDEYVPYKCRQIFIENNWTAENRLKELQVFALSDYNSYSYRHKSIFEESHLAQMHLTCQTFYTHVKSIRDDKVLKALFIKRQDLVKRKVKLERNFKENKSVYDTSLLESIADKDGASLNSVSAVIKRQSRTMEHLTKSLAAVDSNLDSAPQVVELWRMTQRDNLNRKNLIADFRDFEFWYPFKKLLWQLLFMLPFFSIFYLWSSYSAKKDNRIQTLLSSHLLVVASIPILLKVGEVVLDLIPNHFFKALFKILESMHLIAIWHYLVIFAAVGSALLAVYIIQKKIFNKQRVYEKRLQKGNCYLCAKHLPDNAGSCPFCGTKQSKQCSRCNNETYIAGSFCIHCGESH